MNARPARPTRTDRNPRRPLALLIAFAIVAGLGGAYGLSRPPAAGQEPAGQAPEPTPASDPPASETPREQQPMSLAVDAGTQPARDTVPGLDGQPLPVGRIADADGTAMDVILGELLVSYDGDADLDGFLGAFGGEVLDTFDGDDGGDTGDVRDALVRIDTGTVSPDPAEVAAALVRLETDLGGDWTLSDASLLPLLHAATAAPDFGLTAMPHGVYEQDGIPQGATTEGANPFNNRDAFTWPYIASETAQDIGVDTAWRLLADNGLLDEMVPIMVVDQGFRVNADFPQARWIRRGDWNQPGWGSGSWHGTDVVAAAMGAVDNGFGGAGPAGPVAQLIAVEDAGTAWGNIRSLRRLVDEHRPAIVTMSFSRDVTAFRLANQDFYERQFRRIKQDYGALPFASASNDSRNIDALQCSGCLERRLVMPCEAKHVVCVGGFGNNTTARAVAGGGCSSGSNYGTHTGGRSVEIWGPYRTVSEGRLTCGTSFATPFVAGVAALVEAADPSLGPDGIWNILKQTAHDKGDVGAEVTGHQRRINARAAVARALGVQVTAPTVSITSPSTGSEFAHGEWVDLEATVTDYRGKSLPVAWHSSVDGSLSGPTPQPIGSDTLSQGEHTITAIATDGLGNSSGTGINVTILDATPEVEILGPDSGSTVGVTQNLVLTGRAKDSLGKSLPAEDVRWTVRRPGQPGSVASAQGQFATIPAGTLAPGPYEVALSGTVAGASAGDRIAFTVVVPQPGQEPPVIVAPVPGKEAGAGTDNKAAVRLTGYVLDTQGDELPGTRLRWTAESNNGTEVVLCAGSDTPGSGDGQPGKLGPGGLAQGGVDCGDVEVELELEGQGTTWTITLEAYDAGDLRGTAQTSVVVELGVG